MKKSTALFFALVLALSLAATAWAADGPAAKTVGVDIAFEDITDFYYTYDASTAPPRFLRYRFYAEDGTHRFYHETREGGGWPQTEANITSSGTIELTDEQWAAFCDLLRGGTAREREEVLVDGDAGPWLFLYWKGGEKEGREFAFEQPGTLLAFEAYCAELKEGSARRVRVTDGTHTILYELNDSPSAKSLYGMLPLDVEVENYGHNEKIFYPPQAIDAADGVEGSGEAGGMALFSPWGNVVLYYDSFSAYPGLYLLGQAIQGTEQVSSLSGTIHVEAME